MFFMPLLFLTYINDLTQSLSDSGSYLYDDDTSLFNQDKDITIEDIYSI